MQRFSVLILVVAVLACSGQTVETTTTTTTTTTTSSTTTTTAPTTTTEARMQVEGAGKQLTALVHGLYRGTGSADEVPEAIAEAMDTDEAVMPAAGTAFIAEWDEDTRLAVVEADNDVTLAVADPDWRVVGGWWPSRNAGSHLGEFPKVVAVVGSDARPGQDRESARTDSIHFVAMDGKGGAGIVGVPRDSWVSLAGRGNGRINSALVFGGPELMMATFAELTGLDFDGYLLTGFAGFEGMIDVLGGLEMDVPRDFNDKAAKAYLEAGEQVLTPAEALALSRTRKTIPGGDFQRQEHGGLVMMAAQAMLRAAGPGWLPELLAGTNAHLSTDLTPEELLVLGAAIVRVEPDKTVNTVAAGGTGNVGGASVVFLRDSVDQLWEDLADGTLETDDQG